MVSSICFKEQTKLGNGNYMSVLFYGIGLFIIALMIHFFLWKAYLPKNQTAVLLRIFLGTLVSGISILYKLKISFFLLGIPAPQEGYEYLQICLFYISLVVAYVTTYTVLEVDSPSLVMIGNIADAGPDGLAKDTFEKKLNNEMLIIPRIRDLVTMGMVYYDDRVYKLKPKGIFIARIFIVYRKLLRQSQKGG